MPIKMPSTPRQIPWSEFTRILLLIAAPLAIMFPFLTGNIIGGVDARWYAYMLADYLDQVRHGHMIVSVGQGPFAWNGSVHLFRSAPVYMAIARFWDFFTFRRLNPFALEHLTVITSAVAGTLGFYVAAVRILPDRRWTAAGLALLYLGTPSWLATVLCSEAYMSYMAFAAFPLVLYGNGRTALFDDGRGYIILGAGLALVWMCHPPLAFNATMATLFIQSGLIMGRGVVSWKNLAAGVATFAVLAAYYFVSMSELPKQDLDRSQAQELLQIAGYSLFFVGIGRFALVPRETIWALCCASGGFALWVTDYPWLCWAAGTAAVWLACVFVFRSSERLNFKRHSYVLLFLSSLAGAAIAEAWVGRDGWFKAALLTLADNTAHIRELLAPLYTPLQPYQVFQPGWGLLSIFIVIVPSLFGSRPLGAKLFFAASLGLVVCYVRIPLISNFLVGSFPIDFAKMDGVPLGLRLAPVIASFVAISGAIWCMGPKAERRTTRIAKAAILAGLVAWCGFQDINFAKHSYDMTGSPSMTDQNLRPENAMLDAYAYLLLPIPAYYSHGKSDPALESRLLGKDGKVLIGPMQDASATERKGFTKIRLMTHPLANSTTWYGVGAPITIGPQEHVLLRFDFDPRLDYSGYFILKAEHSYREYHLPDSGEGSAFGVGGSRTSVLSLWNTHATPEHYELSISQEPANNIPHVDGHFADLYVSKFDAKELPISLRSLIPYTARISSGEGGTLETFRSFVPGYKATVDGDEAPVSESKQHLVSIPVPPGTHDVELRFVGSARLRIAALISGTGWLCLLASCALGFGRIRHQAAA